jgi:Tfp pilus assembly protein PilF
VRSKEKKRERELGAVIKRGWEMIRQGRDQDALEFLEDACSRFPESAELRMMLATVYRELRPDDVAEQLAKAAELGADDPMIQVRAGHMLWNEDDLEGARACAARASELIDNEFALSADLEGLIGRIAARDGEYDFAEEKLRSAARREPEYSTHTVRLARFLWARGRDEDALAVIDESFDRVRESDKVSLERLRTEFADGT